MLRELVYHNLDYNLAFEYAKDQLSCSYALSSVLLNTIDFTNGQFFTLLPEDADLKRIYEFLGGCILPQNPTHAYVNDLGKISSHTWIPTLKEEMGFYILEKLKNDDGLACVFEDVVNRLDDPHIDFFHQYGFQYLEEMYYFLNKYNASHEEIVNGIHQINSLWHLVFILTKVENPIPVGKNVSLSDFKEFCEHITLLVIGAYDGEGFILWEPNEKLAGDYENPRSDQGT